MSIDIHVHVATVKKIYVVAKDFFLCKPALIKYWRKCGYRWFHVLHLPLWHMCLEREWCDGLDKVKVSLLLGHKLLPNDLRCHGMWMYIRSFQLARSANVLYVGSDFAQHTCTVYPNKYAHGFCFAVLCCGYTLTDFPISEAIRLTSLALWQFNDCPSASKATLVNMDKYFMWIHYERLHNHNKAKHNKTVCIFLGIYCTLCWPPVLCYTVKPVYNDHPMGYFSAFWISSRWSRAT